MEMADYLQFGGRRTILEAFRGVGKSWITSAFVVWLLWRNPEERIMVVSASGTRANDFSRFTRRLIEDVPILCTLKPKMDQMDSVVQFEVGPASPSHSPSVKSIGITGQMTGMRATVIIGDDVEIIGNSATVEAREKLLGLVNEFDNILVPPNGKTSSRIILLGTPQTEDSIYVAKANQGYQVRIWPARYPKEPECYKGCLAPSLADALARDERLVGQPTDPARFDDLDLMEREASMGRSTFQLQFMLDTSLSDANRYPLKLRDLTVASLSNHMAPSLIVWGGSGEHIVSEYDSPGLGTDRPRRPAHLSDHWLPFEEVMMFVDPSGRGSDETGTVVLGGLAGMIHLIEAAGLDGGYDDTVMEAIRKSVVTHKVTTIVVESNFGDGMVAKLLSSYLVSKGCMVAVEEAHATGQKELRIIDTLEPVMNQHRLVIHEDVYSRDVQKAKSKPYFSLFWQMAHITRDRGSLKHDDLLDALAGGVQWWLDKLDIDPETRDKELQEQKLEQEYEKFLQGLAGGQADEDWSRGKLKKI